MLSNFEYTLDEENQTITLTKYVGADATVEISGSYEVDGSAYQIIIDSRNCFIKNTTITAVTIDNGVKFKDNSMYCLFGGCTKLSSVDMTKLDTTGVTDMAWIFYKCQSLTTVDLSNFDTSTVTTMKGMFSYCTKLEEIIGYETFDTSSLLSIYQTFDHTQSLKKVNLSQWDLDQLENSGWCFQVCGAEEILLPDNIAILSAGFLNHASAYADSSFTIPAGVKQIGYAHTFYDFGTGAFAEFKVAEGNENYVSIDGVLYSADGTEIIAVPRAKTFEDGRYEIKEGVTFIPELSFSRNSNVTSVVIPNSYKIRQFVPANDSQYITFEDNGNLNGANSLTIAFYIYTGITEYSVKDDHPLYSSDNGIIYSKDMTTLVAVPARYDQYIDIPEGVTTWNTYAMWSIGSSSVDGCMANCSGVYIPSTLTDIARDQIEMINRLKNKSSSQRAVNDTSDTFSITVAEGNPVYAIDENGYLVEKETSEVIATGTCGGVSWKIDSEGNMILFPTNGESGTLKAFSKGKAPWQEYMDKIKTISFEETVYAAANSQYLFSGIANLESITFDGFDTSNVTNMFAMFYGNPALVSLDLSGFDTSKVTNMRSMFEGCTALSSLNVDGWNTENVTTMYCMFWDCNSLKELDLSDFDTPKATNIAYMFRYCYDLEKLDISNFDFASVTNMSGMFYSDENLVSLKLPEEVDANKVIYMSYLFFGCESLTELDLSGWKQTGALKSPQSMFSHCSSLTTLDLSGLDVRNCRFFGDFFQGCEELKTITIGENVNFASDNQEIVGWPSGVWYYEGTNTGYSGQSLNATDITDLLTKGSIAGTFKKTVNHSIQAGFSVDYKINRISRDSVKMTSTNALFKLDEDYRVYMTVDGSALVEDTYKVPGTFTMTFSNAVSDASGKTYDLQMAYNNITLYEAKTITTSGVTYSQYYHYLFQLTEAGIISVQSLDSHTTDSIINPTKQPTSEYDITLTILDENDSPVDGSFAFSIYDLDIPSTLDYGQENTKNSAEFSGQAYGYYSEGVYLEENDFDIDTLTLADNTFLWEIGDTEKGYRITGTQVDDASELSDLIVEADASGATLTWTGWRCEDFILYNYQPEAAQIQKADEAERLISGANLQLYQYTSEGWGLIDDWTSSNEFSHNIFLAPDKYKLVEVAAPENYYVADEIIFIVNMDYEICDEDGNILETSPILRMTDAHHPISISGTKTWNDRNNKYGLRPENITINLLQNGTLIKSLQLTADDSVDWNYSFMDLPKYDENGVEYIYTVTENEVNRYTTTISGYNITNTLDEISVETISVNGFKIWEDNNDAAGKRPESITINLLADGNKVDSINVTANDSWKWTFDNLPKHSDGNEIIYTISEEMVIGYTSVIEGYNVINRYTPDTDEVLDTDEVPDTDEAPDTGDESKALVYVILFCSSMALFLLFIVRNRRTMQVQFRLIKRNCREMNNFPSSKQ